MGGSRSRKSRLIARRRLASSSSLCQEVMNFYVPCNTPLCHRAPSSIFAARVHTALSTPNVSRLSTVEPSVGPNAWKSSLRQSIQFCSGRPLPGSSPPTSFPYGVLHCLCFVFTVFFWCPCMAINASVQFNDGGLLPDIILLTQCYFHRGTRLYAMKSFCICSL